jgi:hypothetical protein
MTTDHTRPIQLWALDYNPTTGVSSKREYGMVMPDPGPTPNLGSVRGRWKLDDPCILTQPADLFGALNKNG